MENKKVRKAAKKAALDNILAGIKAYGLLREHDGVMKERNRALKVVQDWLVDETDSDFELVMEQLAIPQPVTKFTSQDGLWGYNLEYGGTRHFWGIVPSHEEVEQECGLAPQKGDYWYG